MNFKIIFLSLSVVFSTYSFAMGNTCNFSNDPETAKCITCVQSYDSARDVVENCSDKFHPDRESDPNGTGTNDFGLDFFNSDSWSCVCFPEE